MTNDVFGQRKRSRSEIIGEGLFTGYRGISSDGEGRYRCNTCGDQWVGYQRYAWWPVRLRWSPRGKLAVAVPFFSHHGWEIEGDGFEQRVYGHTLRIGALLINFGKDRR